MVVVDGASMEALFDRFAVSPAVEIKLSLVVVLHDNGRGFGSLSVVEAGNGNDNGDDGAGDEIVLLSDSLRSSSSNLSLVWLADKDDALGIACVVARVAAVVRECLPGSCVV